MTEEQPTTHTAPYSANQIADWFHAWNEYKAMPALTELTLHSLLHYTQGHHLADFGTPLFSNTLEIIDGSIRVPAVLAATSVGVEADENGRLVLTDSFCFDFDEFPEATSRFLVVIWNTYATGRDLEWDEKVAVFALTMVDWLEAEESNETNVISHKILKDRFTPATR